MIKLEIYKNQRVQTTGERGKDERGRRDGDIWWQGMY